MKRHAQPTRRARATRVVNIYDEGYDVYTGCPQSGVSPEKIAPGQYGFLGNPFEDVEGPEKLELWQQYFLDRIKTDRSFRLALLAVRGRRLGCFCEEGEVCHADLIADWLEGQRRAHEHLRGKIET